MWPYEKKRVAILKEFVIENVPKNAWGTVRIPEPAHLYDAELLPHLNNVMVFDDYQSAKYRVGEIFDFNNVERRIEWQQRNTRFFHWCGAVIKDNLVVVFQLNYEPFKD